MNLRSLLLLVLLCTGFVSAQSGGGSGVVSGSAGAFFSGPRKLQGLPYSADVITENTRVLADGNRIHQEMHGKQFRDSEGRTRSETEFPLMPSQATPFQHISIDDPVQGIFINLDPRTKTATIRHFSLPATQANRTNVLSGRLVQRKQPATAEGAESRDRVHSEDLGTMEIEGFSTHGTKHIRTIPAGKIGNEQPITNVDEVWVSPVLKIVLLEKHDDPQSGQRIMKLTNIQTNEPDPSLFQIPSDYTVKDDEAQK